MITILIKNYTNLFFYMYNKPKFNIDFIGIGAEKAGTTQVSEMLAAHPEICISEPKEVSFFNKTESYMQVGINKHYEKDISWYKKHFGHKKKGQILGEFTTIPLRDIPSFLNQNFKLVVNLPSTLPLVLIY